MSSRLNVRMIWAQSRGGVIGAKGALPWHLPEDLALFRQLTLDSTVVMGRVTWESLPDTVRPLPRRRNVVLTKLPGWQAPGAEVVRSPQDVVERYPDCWVIGGAAVYEAMITLATRVVRTEVDEDFDGDTFAPRMGPGWQQVERRPEQGWSASRVGLRYAVGEYARTLRAYDPRHIYCPGVLVTSTSARSIKAMNLGAVRTPERAAPGFIPVRASVPLLPRRPIQ